MPCLLLYPFPKRRELDSQNLAAFVYLLVSGECARHRLDFLEMTMSESRLATPTASSLNILGRKTPWNFQWRGLLLILSSGTIGGGGDSAIATSFTGSGEPVLSVAATFPMGGVRLSFNDQSLHLEQNMSHLDPRYKFIADAGLSGSARVVRALTGPDRERLSPEDAEAADEFFGHLRSADWGSASLLKTFPILSRPAPDDLEDAANVVQICVRLHNLRVRVMGVDQPFNLV